MLSTLSESIYVHIRVLVASSHFRQAPLETHQTENFSNYVPQWQYASIDKDSATFIVGEADSEVRCPRVDADNL